MSGLIQELQNKLNTFNELKGISQIVKPDGIIGPLTKSAVYDFEENNPYFVFQKEQLVGNDRFEGFAVELMTEIAKILHFNITFQLVADSSVRIFIVKIFTHSVT